MITRAIVALLLVIVAIAAETPAPPKVEVANLVYAVSKTSKCFSDAFLAEVSKQAGIPTAPHYVTTRAAVPAEMSRVAFAVMTGEGAFTMTDPERASLKAWMEKGGFLLCSASCSSPEWGASLRREVEAMFGGGRLVEVGKDHPLFSCLNDLRSFPLRKSDGTARFQGVVIDGRLACLFSPEGLNDTANVPGCCCCGGNEVQNARAVVANALVYALVE